MMHLQVNPQAQAALLRHDHGIAAQKTNSLCCAAAGITALSSGTTEALIPQEKLREAAQPEATLNAQNRPLAQPVVGYTPSPNIATAKPAAQDGRGDGDTSPLLPAEQVRERFLIHLTWGLSDSAWKPTSTLEAA